MNLFDSSFLCLDIGSTAVRAIAHRVRSGRITKSAMHSVESMDTVFAIKSVVDELEKQIGTHFDSAYITGNFGPAKFEMNAKSTNWGGEHRILAGDLHNQISQIATPDDMFPMHIIPLRYDTSSARNLLSPVGQVDSQLTSVFGAIFYDETKMSQIFAWLRDAHIGFETLVDPSFLISDTLRDKKQTALIIDLGAEFTTVSIWGLRGPVFFDKIAQGMNAITTALSNALNISIRDAEKIKRNVANLDSNDMDRFTPADVAYDFSRSDVNDIILPMLIEIIASAKEAVGLELGKYNPAKILLCGGGSNIVGIDGFFENTFGIPVQNIGADAAVRALSLRVWGDQAGLVRKYLNRRARWQNILNGIVSIFRRQKKKPTKFLPIMPSTNSFNMKNPTTYELFRAGNISMIHVDIMDGFFVNRIIGGMDELKFIREHTNAHLYVHLMTESPAVWAAAAANAGADTIIVSTNTAGVRAALQKIRDMGKRCGIALNPESPVSILKPILKEIDDILIMSVPPGNGGAEFDEGALEKISILANTRKRYGLKFKIAVDGGINPMTAKACWDAGADLLVSGSYLARAADFPIAVQSLLPNA